MKKKQPDWDRIAYEITDKLNDIHADAPMALTDGKGEAIQAALAPLGLHDDCHDKAYEELSERIGYNYPYITDKEERVQCAAKDMLEALKLAEKIVQTARQYFPKSIRNSDTFMLNNYGVAINKAIRKAEEK